MIYVTHFETVCYNMQWFKDVLKVEFKDPHKYDPNFLKHGGEGFHDIICNWYKVFCEYLAINVREINIFI